VFSYRFRDKSWLCKLRWPPSKFHFLFLCIFKAKFRNSLFGNKYFKIFTVFHRKLKNTYFKPNKSRMVDNVELRIAFLEIFKLNSRHLNKYCFFFFFNSFVLISYIILKHLNSKSNVQKLSGNFRNSDGAR